MPQYYNTSPLLLEEPFRLSDILEHSERNSAVPCLTKIVGTVGGNSRTTEELVGLLEAGMTAARFDFSHYDADYHQETLNNLQAAMRRTKKMCAVIFDTRGPEVTISNPSATPVSLTIGQHVTLTPQSANQPLSLASHTLPISYPFLAESVSVGDEIFIGQYLFTGSETTSVWLEVSAIDGNDVKCEVKNSGTLQGTFFTVHASKVRIDLPTLSDADHASLSTWGQRNRVDVVFLSFTRGGGCIRQARDFICKLEPLKHAHIYAKIESLEGLRNLDEIIAEADGIILGRGDLGVELSAEKVFLLQKVAVWKCNMAGKPVIISRVVDTMTDTPRPTRAEATDVANAVLDGVDAIMLGAETLRGLYPREAVQTVQLICCEAEKSHNQELYFNKATTAASRDELETVCASAVSTAENVQAHAIVVFSTSGRSARLTAKYRPTMPVIVLVIPRIDTDQLHWHVTGDTQARQCLLSRGLFPLMAHPRSAEDTHEATNQTMLKLAISKGKELGVLGPLGRVVFMQADKFNRTIRIVQL